MLFIVGNNKRTPFFEVILLLQVNISITLSNKHVHVNY
jgi:hypothetical protein